MEEMREMLEDGSASREVTRVEEQRGEKGGGRRRRTQILP